jgi:Lrp/AsnC family leucine-responsive transcriptional regulator
MAMGDGLARGGRRQPDTEFLWLDLFRAADLHGLESTGVIRDYVALLDARAVGRMTTVFVEIRLSAQSEEVLDAFERAVARVPDVLECHLMAGTADYLLKVVARDSEDFAQIHRRHLARLPHIAQMQSSFALKTVCKTTALPV